MAYSVNEAARRRRTRTKLRLIDLFAGAGGMTLGFIETGRFESIWANDVNRVAARTFAANFGDRCVAGNLVEIHGDPAFEVPAADVVVGGPPCQGFSLLNKNRSGDARKQLWRPFLEVVERSGARAFVMENVPQLLGSAEFGRIEQKARRIGFRLEAAKLCAADYGVPQTRRRAFIVGVRGDGAPGVLPPPPTHAEPGNKRSRDPNLAKWRTVRDAIVDLPRPSGTEIRDAPAPLDLHFGRNPTELSKRRYRAVPREGMNRFDLQERAPELTPPCWIRKKSGGTDLFGRLWWNRPAFTIRTEFYKPEKGRYLHPAQHRPITHREAARFQGFPDDFAFRGTKIEIARQIGNAVPPPLARCVAEQLVEALAAVR